MKRLKSYFAGPIFDLVIASTALGRNLKLATLNPQHLQGTPRLVVEDWSLA